MERKEKNFEYRFNSSLQQKETDSRLVEGYAIVYESPSDPSLGFVETIKRGAVSEEVLLNSDVFARMNHSNDYILARCNKGKGSLSLELREDGLFYSFSAPNTEKGEELLEHLRRGEITQSSFAFRVADEEDAEKWYKKDGVVYRDIYKISELSDVAPVYNPAYPSSSVGVVSQRALEEMRKLSDVVEEEEREIEEKENVEEHIETNPSPVETEESEEIPVASSQEEPSEEPSPSIDENRAIEEEEGEEKEKEEENTRREIEQTNFNKTINIRKKMKKDFSLLKTINSVINNRSMDEVSAAVLEAGRESFRGLEMSGQIQIPFEMRDITVADEGVDVVATDLWDIQAPLYANNVLAQAGAKFITGLVGNVDIEQEC